VLLQSKNGGQYRQLFDSTRAIHFFGTPHQGLEIGEFLSMIDDLSPGQSSRSDFIKQLQEGTNFLATQKEDIKSLWDQTPGIQIVSFYETMMTTVVKKVRILRIPFCTTLTSCLVFGQLGDRRRSGQNG